jgi:hypothetical protein
MPGISQGGGSLVDGNWIRSTAGRSVVAAVGVAVVAIALVAALTGGDDDTAVDIEPATAAITSTDETDETVAPTNSTTTSDHNDVATTTPTAPASSGVDDTAAPATLMTVPVDTVVVLDPIPLDETSDFGTGLNVRLVEIEAITGEARTQGEISGPALRVTVEVTNTTNQPFSLERTQVEVTYGEDRAPGIVLSGSGTMPFAVSVAPGASSTGTVVFVVPKDQRNLVQVAVTQTTDTPIILFEGSAP